MKLTKKAKALIITGVVTTAAIPLTCGISIKNTSDLMLQKYNELESSSYNAQRAGVNKGEYVVNSNNSINMSYNNIEARYLNNTTWGAPAKGCWSPSGTLVPATNGSKSYYALLDNETGQPIWMKELFGNADKTINMFWYKSANAFVILQWEANTGLMIGVVKANGDLVTQKGNSYITLATSNKTDTYLKTFGLFRYTNSDNTATIIPRGYSSTIEKNKDTFQIWVDSNGALVTSKITYTDRSTSNYWLISSTNFWTGRWDGYDHNQMKWRIDLIVNESNELWFRIFKDLKQDDGIREKQVKYLETPLQISGLTNDDLINFPQELALDVFIENDNHWFRFAGITATDKSASQLYVSFCKYNIDKNKMGWEGSVTLQNSTDADIDIKHPSFTWNQDIRAYDVLTGYSNYNRTLGQDRGGEAIVRMRLNRWYDGNYLEKQTSWNWGYNTGKNDRIQIFPIGSDTLPSGIPNDQPDKIFAFSGPSFNDRIQVFQRDKNPTWLIDPTGANWKGAYAYNTAIKNSADILVEGQTNTDAFAVTDEQLRRLLPSSKLLSYFTRYKTGATATISLDSSTPDELKYKGILNTNISINTSYSSTTTGTNAYAKRVSGFKKWTTGLKKEAEDVSNNNEFKYKKPSLVQDSDIVNYLYTNRDTIFSDLPKGFSKDNIKVIQPNKDDANNRISFKIGLTKYLDTNNIIQTTGFERQFTLNGVGSYKSSTSGTETVTWGDNSQYSNQVNEQWIKQKVIEHKDDLFRNLPDSITTGDIEVIGQIIPNAEEGSLTCHIRVNNVYPLNSSLDIENLVINGFNTAKTTIKPIIPVTTFWPDSTDTAAEISIGGVSDAIIDKQDVIFENKPASITRENVTEIRIDSRSQTAGTVNVSFTLTNALPSGNARLSFQITELKKIITRAKESQISVSPSEYSSTSITTEQLTDIIKTKVNDMLEGIPKNYSLDDNPIVLGEPNRNPNGTSLEVDVTFNNVYADSPTGLGPYKHRYTFTGFKANATVINISDNEQWGDDQVYAKDRANEEQIKQLIISKLPSISSNLPDPWDANTKLEVVVNSHDDQHGTINVSATFNDVYGNTSNGLTNIEKTFTISGYRLMETTVKENGTFNFGSDNKLASADANDNAIKAILATRFNEMFDNIPNGFQQSDIGHYTIGGIKHHDNIGRLEFDLTVNGVYGPQLSNQLTQHIIFNGYQSEVTDWKASTFRYGNDSLWASDPKVNNEQWVTKQVKDNINNIVQGLPIGWNKEEQDNIIVSDLRPKDKEGKLVFHLKLNKVFAPSKETFIEQDITFIGFSIPETKWKQDNGIFSIGNDQQLAKDNATVQKVQQTIITHINDVIIDKPKEFVPSESNIQVLSDIRVDNASGSITCTIRISDVFGKNNSNFIEKEITITGYKGEKTSWKPNLTLAVGNQYGNKPASEAAKDHNWIKTFIGNNLASLVNNLPDPYDKNNIIIEGSPKANDAEGKLVVTIKLQNIYGSPNYIQSDITITGFSARTTAFTTESTFDVRMPNVDPESYSDPEIKEYIYQHIELFVSNLPEGFNPNGILLENIVKSNAKGSITLKLKITNTIQGETISKDISLIGFRQTNTKLVSNNVPIGNNSLYATDSSITKESVKQLVETNIHKFATGLPSGYEPHGKVTINGELERNITKGTISFNLQLTGVNSNDKTVNGKVTISGYKTSGLTTIIDTTPTVSNSDKLPSELTVDDIKQIIVDNNIISNTLNGKPLSVNDLEVQIISTNNETGEIRVSVNLVNGGWVEGQKQSINFNEIVISGFKLETIKFNWWIWLAIGGTLIFLILLIVLLVLIIKKKKIQNQKINNISVPPRPMSQQLAHNPNQPVNRPTSHPLPKSNNSSSSSITTTKVVKQTSKSNNSQNKGNGKGGQKK